MDVVFGANMLIQTRWSNLTTKLVRKQDGIGLAEVLVAVAIISSAIVALLSSMTTGASAVQLTDEHVTARHLAEAQLEYIKSYPYSPGASSYPLADIPTRHGLAMIVNVSTASMVTLTGGDDTFLGATLPGTQASIQEVTVTVTQPAKDDKVLITLTTLKGNR